MEATGPVSPSVRGSLGAGEGSKTNLRRFLEKLGLRRKRIVCSAAGRRKVAETLLPLGGGSLAAPDEPCHVHYDALREVLRNPPKGVQGTVLRDLVEVARAYTSYGDGYLDVHELISCALQIDPGILGRIRPFMPLVLMILWLFLSPLVLCANRGWSFVDGLYVGVLMMSTVGSTDRLPDDDGLKIFMIVFVPVGLGLTIWMVVTCVSRLLIAHEAHLWSLLSPRDNADLLAGEGHGDSSCLPPLEDLATGSWFARYGARGSPGSAREAFVDAAPSPKHLVKRRGTRGCLQELYLWGARWPLHTAAALSLLLMLIIVSAGLILAVCISEEVGFVAALYWSVATCTTVGYGAAHPHVGDKVDEKLSRGLQLAFVILALAGGGVSALMVSGAYLHSRAARLEGEFKKRRQLGFDFLFDLDRSGEGISQLEFLCAGLMAKDKVSADDLWEVLAQFWRLDSRAEGRLWPEQLRELRRNMAGRPAVADDAGPLPARSIGGPAETEERPDWPGLRVLQEEIKRLNKALQDKDRELAEAEQANANLQRRLQDLVCDLKKKQEEVAQANATQTELKSRADEDQRRREQATQDCEEWRKRCYELDARAKEADKNAQEANQRREEAEKRLQSRKQQLNEANGRLKLLEQQLQDSQQQVIDQDRRVQAEIRAREAAQVAQDQERQLRLQAEAKVNDIRVQYAEMDLTRQAELRNTLLNMQALQQQILQRPRPGF